MLALPRAKQYKIVLLSETTDDIPLPNTTIHIDIPLLTNELRSLNESDLVAVLINKTNKKIKDITLDDIYPIAIFGEIKEITHTDLFASIEIELWSRLIVENILISSMTNVTEAVCQNLKFSNIEKDFIDKITAIKQLILTQERVLTNASLNALKKTQDPEDIMYILGNQFLKSKSDRLLALCAKNHQEIHNLLLSSIISTLESSYSSKPKITTVTKKTAVKEQLSMSDKIRLLPIYREQQTSLDRELVKLDTLSNSSSEYHSTQEYLNWILDIPWNKYSSNEIDLNLLETNLNRSHYGLEEVKQNIIEHFCVSQITKVNSGQVLCFTGPPGTGKTTIAKEIANVASLPLLRIPLGGVSDESEIRGFRRTYTNSRPGRIVIGLANAKVMNPVILFDEVEKAGESARGNPLHALLELLDKEQNDKFTDRYIELPINLSKCLFICTANDINSVHPALKDRMEVIEFREYSAIEKKIIIEEFLIQKITTQYNNNNNFDITFSQDLIDYLSQTLSIRQIEKTIDKLYRNAITSIYRVQVSSINLNLAYYNNILQNNIVSTSTNMPKKILGFK